MSETSGHKKLKRIIESVFLNSGFEVDTEVQVDWDGDGREYRSFDVAALIH